MIARVSRGAGLPEALPDFFGIAARLVDSYGPGRHQDLLINASSSLPVLQEHDEERTVGILLVTGDRGLAGSFNSQIIRAGVQLQRELKGEGKEAAMRAAIGAGVAFAIAVAAPLGRWQPIGVLQLRDPLPPDAPDVDFDPWNTGGGLVPATWLNRIRREAYRQSRLARGRPG